MSESFLSLLLGAYRSGLFPMADPRGRIGWYESYPRAILELDAVHVPRSLQKRVRRKTYEIAVDRDFRAVIEGCARRPKTWISRRIIEAYCTLHQRGLAHSVEAWKDGVLCGGLYGLTMGGAFFGESMFAAAPDASKVCVVALVERLRERGFTLLDCQTNNPHMARFGTRLLTREAFLARLAEALARPCHFNGWQVGGDALLERR